MRFLVLLVFMLTYFDGLSQDIVEIIVKVDNTEKSIISQKDLSKLSLDKAVKSVRKTVGNNTLGNSVLDGIYKISVRSGPEAIRICDSLHNLDGVIYAEIPPKVGLLKIPNDPQAQEGGNQTYLSVINAFEAWDISTSSPEITIGVLDTGTDPNHEDIAANLFENDDPVNGIDDDENGYIDDISGYDFAENDNDPTSDNNSHGTRVSGLTSATTDNGVGIAGMGYEAKLLPLKIFTSSNNFSSGAYEAIVYAADNGADIINLSWGGTGSFSQYQQDIITYAAVEKNVVITAAAGNTPSQLEFFPASYQHVLSVSSTNLDDTKSSFATYHPRVDLTAPGGSIYSTQNDDTYGTDTGTSYSAPLTAGVAALVKDVFPNLTSLQIMERIRVTTENIYDIDSNQQFYGKLGKGRLDALKAVTATNLISIRPANWEVVSKQNGDKIYFGDTISISGQVINYLNPVDGMVLSLDSLGNGLTKVSDQMELGFLNTLDQTNFTDIELVIDDGVAPSSSLEFSIIVNNSDYSDFEILEVSLEPDYYDFGDDSLSITITGDGDLGFDGENYGGGSGLEWLGNQIASNMGFGIPIDSVTVFDNFINDFDSFTKDQDFISEMHTKPLTHDNSQFGYHVFADTSNNFRVEQTTLKWDSLPSEVIVLSLRVTNNSPDTIFNQPVGFFMDYDISNTEFAFVDTTNTSFLTDENQTYFGGIRIQDTINTKYSFLDIDSLIEENLITDSLKYTWFESLKSDSSDFNNPSNLALLAQKTIDTLLAYEARTIHFLIGADSSQNQLNEKFDLAIDKLDLYFNAPYIEEVFISCEGGTVEVDPKSGKEFYFFRDSQGLDTLAIADSLIVGPLNGDSVIYIANKDSLYTGPIRGIRINLSSEIANFDFIDTLLLGDSDNKVQFIDESFDPTSWEWDFGNGLTASGLENPLVKYDTIGKYTVTLTVENTQGCSGTKTKTLNVLNRPNEPEINDLIICEGENAVVKSSGGDTLRHYFSALSTVPISEDVEISIPEISTDTSLFFSKVSEGVESTITSVNVLIDRPSGQFEKKYITDSLNGHYVLLTSQTKNFSKYEWAINETTVGQGESYQVQLLDSGQLKIQGIITSLNNCSNSVTDTLFVDYSEVPVIENLEVCMGDSISIKPTGGSLFGFYSDTTLINALYKGEELTLSDVTSDTSFVVVGLDSYLPGEVVEITIKPIQFEFSINANPDSIFLDENFKTTFSTTDSTPDYNWYLDSLIIGKGPQLTLLFDSVNTHTVWAEGINAIGCVYSDTLVFSVLESRPVIPLGISTNENLLVYPNPADDNLNLISDETIEQISIQDMSGKIRIKYERQPLDISSLENGLYFIKVLFQNGTNLTRKIIIRR